MRKSMSRVVLGGFLFSAAMLVMVGSSAGCTAPVEEEPVAETESELGRDPAYCRDFSSYTTRYDFNTSCTWNNPPTDVQNQVSNTINNLGGAGSCVGFVVSVATLATTSVTIVLSPLAIGAAASAGGSAVGCGAWIGTELARLTGGMRCTTTTSVRSEQRFSESCRVACGSYVPRVVGGSNVATAQCFCAVRPLACTDAPVSTPTPGPTQYPQGACVNRGNNATVAHGRCTDGYTNGRTNGLRWRCRSTRSNYTSNTWDPC